MALPSLVDNEKYMQHTVIWYTFNKKYNDMIMIIEKKDHKK